MAETREETPTLREVVPPMVLKVLTGNCTGPRAISEWCYVKRIPTWTVYVLTADPTWDAALPLHHLFRDIPCRFFALQWFDFFPLSRQHQQQQRSQRISQIPLYLLSSLKYAMSKTQHSHESILLFDTKQSQLEHVASRGSIIMGHGAGPPLHIFNKNPEHRFQVYDEPPRTVSAYLEIMGIVKVWEDRSQGCQQRRIWMDGCKADTDLLQSFFGKSATPIQAVPNLVHHGVETVLKEQTDIHGEISEPLDLLLVGQRVKFANTSLFGTVRNAIPRENNTNIQEFQYNVEMDVEQRQQLLGINQLIGTSFYRWVDGKREKPF